MHALDEAGRSNAATPLPTHRIATPLPRLSAVPDARPRSGRPTHQPAHKAGRAVIHRLRSRPAEKAATAAPPALGVGGRRMRQRTRPVGR